MKAVEKEGWPSTASRRWAAAAAVAVFGIAGGAWGFWAWRFARAKAYCARHPVAAAQQCQLACSGGDAQSCGRLADLYEDGRGGLGENERMAAQTYRKACDGGDSRACVRLGKMHESGKGGVELDRKQAARLYQRACDAGGPAGCHALGLYYQWGEGGLNEDAAKAAALFARALPAFQKGCAGRDAESCWYLGEMQAAGLVDVGKDETLAVKLYVQACNLDSAFGCAELGAAHERGGSTVQNKDKAAELYGRACAAGSDLGCYHLAATMAESGQAAAALTLFEENCDEGSAAGCAVLGTIYQHGSINLPKDAAAAARFYARACDLDVHQCFHLAGALRFGDLGLPIDQARAVELYERGCKRRNLVSCYVLGLEYSSSGEQDLPRALAYLVPACEEGDAMSCVKAGEIYGEKMPEGRENRRESLVYFERACDLDKDFRFGCIDLGDALRDGYGGSGDGRDVHAAILAYGKACEDTTGYGCFKIGQMYQAGDAEIPADQNRAAEHFRRGCDLYDDSSCISLSEMVREGWDGHGPGPREADELLRKGCNLVPGFPHERCPRH